MCKKEQKQVEAAELLIKQTTWELQLGEIGWTQINPVTRNRTRDHLITAKFYSQMLYQLSYSRLIKKLDSTLVVDQEDMGA